MPQDEYIRPPMISGQYYISRIPNANTTFDPKDRIVAGGFSDVCSANKVYRETYKSKRDFYVWPYGDSKKKFFPADEVIDGEWYLVAGCELEMVDGQDKIPCDPPSRLRVIAGPFFDEQTAEQAAADFPAEYPDAWRAC